MDVEVLTDERVNKMDLQELARTVERLTLDYHEVAAMLGVSVGLVRLECQRRRLRPVRIGRRRLFTREEVQRHLNEMQQKDRR
ncbi:MAG: helix-turn-helix domain-containing protein [Candidatus Binataceae bacterium]